MKKITLVAFLCAMIMAPSVNAQEVAKVQDPSQGYLLNRFQDNWFISAEAGAGVFFSHGDKDLKFGKRITPSFNLSVGKWFSPIIGLRLGADVYKAKGLTEHGIGMTNTANGNMFEQKFWQVGPAADVLVNVTNWWCGYHPGRVYNAVVYAGFDAHFALVKGAKGNDKWGRVSSNFGARVGLLNTFALSKQVDFLLDLRVDLAQAEADGPGYKRFNGYGTVMAGFAYKFKKRTWSQPEVTVMPEVVSKYSDAEGDALVARLQAADGRISSLESQLKAALNRPTTEVAQVVSNNSLATVYFPIGSSKLSGANAAIVRAAARAMKQTDKKYVVTGWADSYTGTAKVNDNIRANRANAIVKLLMKNGVKKDQITVNQGSGNLTSYGKPCANLDRAVTILEAE
ncbi:MAG: OmpA family protein [Muribaculaceae bacterium]